MMQIRRARYGVVAALAAWSVLPALPQGAASETGMASWYGYPHHGRFSASGEVYDMDQLTAAHPTLPFNSMVRVVNLSNDRSVEVRITDRGPFVDGRIIDLSRAAARSIGLFELGTAQVRLEVVGTGLANVPVTPVLATVLPRAIFGVQTGAFRNPGNAERYVGVMRSRYGTARMVATDESSGIWRVVTGAETTREAADELCARIRHDSGENNAFVVRLDSSHEPDPGRQPSREQPSGQQPSRPSGTIAADGLHPPAN